MSSNRELRHVYYTHQDTARLLVHISAKCTKMRGYVKTGTLWNVCEKSEYVSVCEKCCQDPALNLLQASLGVIRRNLVGRRIARDIQKTQRWSWKKSRREELLRSFDRIETMLHRVQEDQKYGVDLEFGEYFLTYVSDTMALLEADRDWFKTRPGLRLMNAWAKATAPGDVAWVRAWVSTRTIGTYGGLLSFVYGKALSKTHLELRGPYCLLKGPGEVADENFILEGSVEELETAFAFYKDGLSPKDAACTAKAIQLK